MRKDFEATPENWEEHLIHDFDMKTSTEVGKARILELVQHRAVRLSTVHPKQL